VRKLVELEPSKQELEPSKQELELVRKPGPHRKLAEGMEERMRSRSMVAVGRLVLGPECSCWSSSSAKQ